MNEIRHVVNLSGGVCSFWCAKRVVEKHGREGVVLLFADVMMEDEDLYRFNADIALHLGIPITRISKEISPWELFAQQGMIGNSRAPLCSVMLKRDPLDEWRRANTLEMTATMTGGAMEKRNRCRFVFSASASRPGKALTGMTGVGADAL